MELAGRQVDVLVRWRDHAREWARRHLPGMAEARIDPDANPADAEIYARLAALERQAWRPPVNYGVNGNGNGHARLGWLVTLNIGVTLAVSAWVVSTIIEQGQDIATIKCQLNPQCAQAVPRVRSP